MPRTPRLIPPAALILLLILPTRPARAAEVRLIESSERGVTLQLDLDDVRLGLPDEDGRRLPAVSGLERTDVPGRARLPYGRAILALPLGTRAVARVISSGPEEVRDDIRLAICGQPGFERDGTFGQIPVVRPMDPIRDGVWPPQPATASDVITVRERRLVGVDLYPVRYDEVARRLTFSRSLVVRVDFVAGPAGKNLLSLGADSEPDPHADPVFASQVLNWDQGRAWQGRRPSPRDGGLGFARGASPTRLGLPNSGPAAPAFDESAPEVRVRCDTTGFYALEFDSLAIYGYPLGIPIAEVSVHRHEFVEDATVPYVTYELPIEVEDANHNSVFDSGDRIIVWVWDWAQRSRASVPQRDWGDAEVIYATRKPGGTGLAIAHRNAWLGRSDLTPLASYPLKQRFQKLYSYNSTPIDTTFERILWSTFTIYSAPQTYAFEVDNIDATRPSTVTVNWQGVYSGTHTTWASVINGLNQTTTVVDSSVWSGFVRAPRTGTVPAGGLTEGATNTLKLWGFNTDYSGTNQVVYAGFHSFDVTYWRSYAPITGYLSCNSGTEVGDWEIRAGPFTNAAELRAYDVNDSLNPVRLDNVVIETGATDAFLRLQDSPSAARREYVILDTPRSPAPGAMSAVKRYDLTNQTAGDYLLITPEGYVNSVQPLAALHRAQGLRVLVAPLEGINDEFNGGRPSPYAIRRYVRYAYNAWKARYVLLVGDGSEDPRELFPNSSPELVPAPIIPGPVGVFTGPESDFLHESIPGDAWYGFCLNCVDPSSSNMLLDVSIGRLPVSSVAQLDGVVSKIVKYDDLSGDQSWRRNVLLMADDMFSGVTTFGGGGGPSDYCRRPGESKFLEIDQVVDTMLANSAGLGLLNRELFNLSYYLPNRPGDYTTSGGTDTCRINRATFETRARAAATPALFARLNAGRLWWSYQGHANEYVMSHESFYVNQFPTDDKDRFLNDGKPVFFSAFSCHPNSFGRLRGGADPQIGPCFGEEMVTLPNRGAIASFASAGFELVPGDQTKHLEVHVAKAMLVDPPRDEVLGDRGARAVLGDILQAAFFGNFFSHLSSPGERDVAASYNLLGDPATRITIGKPQAIVTANAVPVTSGQDIRLHTPLDTLRVEADLASNVRLDTLQLVRTLTGGSTVIWKSPDPLPAGLTITPAFPDTALVSAASRYGGRRFHLTLQDNLIADSYRYTIRSVDRYQQVTSFDLVFGLRTVLQVGGSAIADDDIVAPTAPLSLVVLCPKPVDPSTDLHLQVGNVNQVFTWAPANGDVSGREWVLSWNHAPYPARSFDVRLSVVGGGIRTNTFRVTPATGVKFGNAMAFPNPFDDDYLNALSAGRGVATVFSFDLISAAPADVTLRIFTISGRLIYEHTERALDARYHQIPWNGLDAEGYPLANGVYFYKLMARSGSSTDIVDGRLVKLRRPRRSAEPATPN